MWPSRWLLAAAVITWLGAVLTLAPAGEVTLAIAAAGRAAAGEVAESRVGYHTLPRPSARFPHWAQRERCWRRGEWQRLPEAELSRRRRSWVMHASAEVPPARMDNWTWVVPPVSPHDPCHDLPELLAWDRARFCHVLGGRSMFVVGDSLSAAFVRHLFSLAGARYPCELPQCEGVPAYGRWP